MSSTADTGVGLGVNMWVEAFGVGVSGGLAVGVRGSVGVGDGQFTVMDV